MRIKRVVETNLQVGGSGDLVGDFVGDGVGLPIVGGGVGGGVGGATLIIRQIMREDEMIREHKE